MSKTIKREVCNVCKKKNLCSYYNDQNRLTKRCLTDGCKPSEGKENMQETKEENTFLDVEKLDFKTPELYRGLNKETCSFGGLKVCEAGNTTITSYEHLNLDNTLTMKFGFRPSKIFQWKDKTPSTTMYMLSKCTDFTRPLYITEGNEDCLTLWQLGYQACSIHSANSERECINNDLEYLKKFPAIILSLDTDHAGTQARNNIVQMLEGQVLLKEISLLPYKDCNDFIKELPEHDVLIEKIHSAKEIVPKGVIFGDEIDLEELRQPLPKGLTVPLPKTMEFIRGGMLPGDMWLFTAGVSIGKSTVMRLFCSHFKKEGYKVANLFVEESKKVAMLNYVAEDLGYPIGDILVDPTIIPEDLWNQSVSEVFDSNCMFINEYWERSTDNLLKTVKYLANVKKYDIIVLDHLTAIINSSGVGKGGKVHDIDWLMEQLFNLCKETGVRLLLVSHLKRTTQPPYWDEGKEPSMYDLRGSGSLEGKPDVIISLFRNMKDPYKVDQLNFEVLKNRWFSEVGKTDVLYYVKRTGRLKS